MSRKKSFFIILTFLFSMLILPLVLSFEYIKSVQEIPIRSGYEIILNYPIERDEIHAKFIDDDAAERSDVEIKEYYKMPDGTIKIKINYNEDADRIVFYYADTFDDWYLRGMDAKCDYLDLQHIDSPDCIWERGYPISMNNVRLYKDSKRMYIDLKNVADKGVDISKYQFFYEWGRFISGVLSDRQLILLPGAVYTVTHGGYDDRCARKFFIGLLEEGKTASAIHNKELECLEHQPVCGDLICSKYEKFLNCDKDCNEPINLIVKEGKENGIYFDYSYLGDSCIYKVYNPRNELFTSNSLKNYKGENLKDTNVRYENQITEQINKMFSSFVTGNYNLELICYENGLEASKQSKIIFIEKVGFFKKIFLRIKSFFL